LILSLFLTACAAQPPARIPTPARAPSTGAKTVLPMMGVTIQVGAFADLDNAVRLTEALQTRGLEATFFKDDDGLFKVRFGNFTSREAARRRALALQADGTLDVFYILGPEEYAAAQSQHRGKDYVRKKIVQTASGFLGSAYRWGGTSPGDGFDCSGLTMTAYRLHGYDLPRSSREQFSIGDPISPDALQPADLVFFAMRTKSKVSHVGLYIGDGRFIHAPGRGQTIRIDTLDQNAYRRSLIGARRFI